MLERALHGIILHAGLQLVISTMTDGQTLWWRIMAMLPLSYGIVGAATIGWDSPERPTGGNLER